MRKRHIAAMVLLAIGVTEISSWYTRHHKTVEPTNCPLLNLADLPPSPKVVDPPRIVDAPRPDKMIKNNADTDEDAFGVFDQGIRVPEIVTPPKEDSVSAPGPADYSTNDYVDIEAFFPGGDSMWNDYLRQTIMSHMNEVPDKEKSGTVRILFTVDEDGTVCAAKALTLPGTKLAEIAVNAFLHGPKWNPAQQNGRLIQSSRCQEIAFQIPNDSVAATNDTVLKKK